MYFVTCRLSSWNNSPSSSEESNEPNAMRELTFLSYTTQSRFASWVRAYSSKYVIKKFARPAIINKIHVCRLPKRCTTPTQEISVVSAIPTIFIFTSLSVSACTCINCALREFSWKCSTEKCRT